MERITKRSLALALRDAGRTVEEIATALHTSPSYVANCLARAGRAADYSDLYTSSTAQNGYARQFRGVLRFRDMDAARESVRRIDSLFRRYVDAGDKRGQHQAQLMALIGKNRAEGIGKMEEARLFRDWLAQHLELIPPQEGCHLEDADEEPGLFDEQSPYEASLAWA